jgi:hypothetical protein
MTHTPSIISTGVHAAAFVVVVEVSTRLSGLEGADVGAPLRAA